MQALGMIETKGLIAAVEGLDSMLKAADVNLINGVLVGAGLVNITIEGDVGAVKAAVDAGVAAVQALDPDLLSSEHVIPRPDASIDGIAIVRRGAEDDSEPDAPDPEPSPDDGGEAPMPEKNDSEASSAETVPEKDTAGEKHEETVKTEALNVSGDKVLTQTAEVSQPAAEESDEADEAVRADEAETAVSAEEDSESTAGAEAEKAAEPEAEEVPEKTAESPAEEQKPEAEAEKPADPAELPEVKSRDDVDSIAADFGVDALDTALAGLRVSELRKLARGYKGFSLTGRDISKANKHMLIKAFKEYYDK